MTKREGDPSISELLKREHLAVYNPAEKKRAWRSSDNDREEGLTGCCISLHVKADDLHILHERAKRECNGSKSKLIPELGHETAALIGSKDTMTFKELDAELGISTIAAYRFALKKVLLAHMQLNWHSECSNLT
jgi:hypothetical protein